MCHVNYLKMDFFFKNYINECHANLSLTTPLHGRGFSGPDRTQQELKPKHHINKQHFLKYFKNTKVRNGHWLRITDGTSKLTA